MADIFKLSRNCRLYRNTGSYGSPTWNLIEHVGDVTLPLTKSRVDVATRASGWDLAMVTGKKLDLKIKVPYVPGDPDYQALQDAWEDDTSVELLILDGPVGTSGSSGWRAHFHIVDVTINQSISSHVEAEITFAVAAAAINEAPVSYVVP